MLMKCAICRKRRQREDLPLCNSCFKKERKARREKLCTECGQMHKARNQKVCLECREQAKLDAAEKLQADLRKEFPEFDAELDELDIENVKEYIVARVAQYRAKFKCAVCITANKHKPLDLCFKCHLVEREKSERNLSDSQIRTNSKQSQAHFEILLARARLIREGPACNGCNELSKRETSVKRKAVHQKDHE